MTKKRISAGAVHKAPTDLRKAFISSLAARVAFEVYQAGKCFPKQWAYDNWDVSYKPGTIYNAVVSVDPDNIYQETNEFDNVATVVGIP